MLSKCSCVTSQRDAFIHLYCAVNWYAKQLRLDRRTRRVRMSRIRIVYNWVRFSYIGSFACTCLHSCAEYKRTSLGKYVETFARFVDNLVAHETCDSEVH